jgi:hypothetical protein
MISVLRGNGDGTFAAVESYPSGGRALNRIVVTDVDGDGIVDIATSHLRSQSAAVLHGRSDGTFESPVVFAAGATPVTLAVADVNGDSHPDLISANEGVDSAAPNLTFLLATAEGSFLASEQLLDAADPVAAAVADFDSDGVADIAVGAKQSRQVVIFRGSRDASNTAAIFVSLEDEPRDLVATDFDRDGRSDIAVLSAGEVAFLFAEGAGLVLPPITVLLPSLAGAVLAPGDFDGDGDVDLAIGRPRMPYAIDIVRNDGGRGFTALAPFEVAGPISVVAAGDFDGNGRDDLAVNSADNHILLFANDEGGLGAAGMISTAGIASALVVGDVDGNGTADIVGVTPAARRLVTFLNDGTGAFSPGQMPGIGFASDVTLRDLDSDAFPEAIVADPLAGETLVLQNDGTGSWRALEPLTTGERPAALGAGDFDDDGRYDLVASGATVARHFNETDGHRSLRGDGNGDGDITAADFVALTLELFDGDGTQVEGVARGSFAGDAGVDADGDGAVTTTEAPTLLLRWTLPPSH